MTISYGTVQIDGVEYPLAKGAEVNENATDRFPPKVTFGDYSYDSSDLLSAWVLSDLSGGHGVIDLREGVTDNRYAIGNMYTRHPNKWSKPFRITRAILGAAASSVYPLGQMFSVGFTGTMEKYFVRNTAPPTLYEGTTSRGTITGAATNHATSFMGAGALAYLYIPQGQNGYSTFEPAGNTLTNTAGAELMVDFALWADKLIGIDGSGQLYYATTAAAVTTFTSYGVYGKINDPSVSIRKLLIYKNQAGEPSIHVVTNRKVYIFDPDSPRLYEIPLLEGVHPYFGNVSAVWRGNMYIAAGMDVLEYNGSVVRNIGLSRDDGFATGGFDMSIGSSPVIVDLAASQNGLYALVDGTISGTHWLSVHEWSGFGWCMIERQQATACGMMVFTDTGVNNLIWGSDAGKYSTQPLPLSYTNPAVLDSTLDFGHAAGSGVSAYATTYTLITGVFDANMPAYRKLASAIAVDFYKSNTDDTLTLYYRFPDAAFGGEWTQIVAINDVLQPVSSGIVTTSLGTVDANGIYPGLSFKKIQFKLEITQTTNNSSATMIIRSVVLYFLKAQNPAYTWTFNIDMSKPFDDRSPEKMYTDLVALKDARRFYSFSFHSGTTFRAKIGALSSSANVQGDFGRTAMVTLVEIPTELGVP